MPRYITFTEAPKRDPLFEKVVDYLHQCGGRGECWDCPVYKECVQLWDCTIVKSATWEKLSVRELPEKLEAIERIMRKRSDASRRERSGTSNR